MSEAPKGGVNLVVIVKIALAGLLMGTLRLFNIKWNPWITGGRDDEEKDE